VIKMAYLKYKQLIESLNKIVPGDYLVKTKLKVIIDPQNKEVYIEVENEKKA